LSTSRLGSVLPRALVALACALLALVGCERPEARPSPLQRILSSGEMRAGTSADTPPMTMRDRDGQLIGLEVDLVRALADTMNVKVRFVEIPFAELIPALERGEIDLAVAGMTITPERNARVAFAGPYFISGNTLLARNRELAETEDLAQLDDPKLSFAALEASTSARFVRTHLPKARLVTVPDNDAGVKALLAGEVDGMVSDLQVCTIARARNPDTELYVRQTPFTTEPLGIALAPDSPLFLNLVTNYLNTLEETSALAQMKAKWLGDSAWLGQLP
jgi:polar amino acid transport system substrate-binding protein